MQRQREQIQTLEIALNKAELFIHANKLDLQTYNGEKMRSIELVSTFQGNMTEHLNIC
jgi:hypothetical protein